MTSWDQMYDKAIKDMEANTGIYDFVYIEQDIIYSYLSRDFLNLSQLLEEQAALKAPDFSFDAFTSFIDYFKDPEAGDVYGVPMEAFIKVYLYRKDLFENPEAQAAFKEKYGYDLAPATTHDQHRDIAEFFTQWGEDHDMELWGTTVQAVSGHPASFYEFFETIAPSFGVYNWGINLETGGASVENGGTLNSDKAKAALEFWLGLLEYAPPEATSSTWDEVAASFAAGRAAQGWVYGENAAWIATDDSRSNVVGNVGVALPPTAAGVLGGRGRRGLYRLLRRRRLRHPALVEKQGGGAAVAAVYRPALGPSGLGGRGGADRTHRHLRRPQVQEMDPKVDGYFTLMEEKGDLFAGAPPYPFHAQVREVIAPHIYEAIVGNVTPAQALDEAAAAAEAELKQLGYGGN